MSRTPRTKDLEPQMTKDVIAEITRTQRVASAEDVEQRLRHDHAIGERIRARDPEGVRASAMIRKAARTHRRSTRTVQDAPRFARAYSQSGLDQVCHHRTAHGMPSGWGHIRHLMRVGDKQKRRKLERRAVAQDWDAEQVEAEVQELPRVKTRGGARHGGRPFVVPRSLADGVRPVVEHGDEWVKRCAAWGAEERSLVALIREPPTAEDIGRRTELIKNARAALHRIQRAAFALEDRLEKAQESGREPARPVTGNERAIPGGPGAVARTTSRGPAR